MAALIVKAVEALTAEIRALRAEQEHLGDLLLGRVERLEDVLEVAGAGTLPEDETTDVDVPTPADVAAQLESEPVPGELDLITGKPAGKGRAGK